LSLLIICSSSSKIIAQKILLQYDTAYYESYTQKVTGRVYFSRKFTSLQFRNADKKYAFNYLPNTTLNFGVGATYRWTTLNLAYGFAFLNPDLGRGKTKYLDLQFHSYGRKFMVDVFGQFYKGFYLSEKEFRIGNESYYRRPDLHVNLIGASSQYVLNHRRFSYRSSFLQNEWQKKSAGTFLIGLEAYVGWMKADSSIVPAALSKDEIGVAPDRIRFLELGPNVGYAYTFVLEKHFFLTGSASVSFDLGTRVLKDDIDKEPVGGVSVNSFLRFVGGYNSDIWSIAALYITDNVSLPAGGSSKKIFLNTGNYRLNFAYRFRPNKKAKKILHVIDDVKTN
jgi:hypothetical protein